MLSYQLSAAVNLLPSGCTDSRPVSCATRRLAEQPSASRLTRWQQSYGRLMFISRPQDVTATKLRNVCIRKLWCAGVLLVPASSECPHERRPRSKMQARPGVAGEHRGLKPLERARRKPKHTCRLASTVLHTEVHLAARAVRPRAASEEILSVVMELPPGFVLPPRLSLNDVVPASGGAARGKPSHAEEGGAPRKGGPQCLC